MRTTHILAVVAAAVALAGTASAKPLLTEQFKANAAIRIDPSRAYILVRSPGMDLQLLRVPDDADRAAYAAERSAALAKAHAKYVKAIASYAREMREYQAGQNTGAVAPSAPPKEPTETNFAYPSIDSDNFVTVWGGRVFDKGGPRTVHLIAVPPGTYRVYGQIFGANNTAISGFCVCMGSVQFDAAAGTITDMGTIHYPKVEARVDKVDPSWNGLTPGKGGLTAMRVEPASASTYVPAVLASLPRVAAAYRASGKMNNYFGMLVDRLTALPGVLGYDRDEVVDERTHTPVGAD